MMQHTVYFDFHSFSGWNLDFLFDFLPSDILSLLELAIVDPLDEDLPLWKLSSNGKFSAQSLKAVLHISSNYDSPEWGILWNSRAPPKLNYFLWQARHGRLKTKELLARSILSSSVCSLCGSTQESHLHVLRDCDHAFNIWSHLLPRNMAFVSQFKQFHLISDWIDWNLDSTTYIHSSSDRVP